MNIEIEKLRKEDLKEAVSIYDENHSLKTNYEKLFSIYDEIYNNKAYHNIVAKINGKIVGLATVIINYDIVEDLKPFLTIWNFGVHSNYRRQGIGTKMFEYINKYAKDNECSFISLIAETDNVIAQSFYENMGFTKGVGYVKMLNSTEE